MTTIDLFHRIDDRFLYVAKKTRLDLEVAVVFLCKRVKAPNMEDWKKLERLIPYIHVMIHLPLILGSDDSGNMILSINASFAVHMDLKSHVGYCLTLRTRSPI